MATPARWTVMVYLAGDNSLSEAGERDLEEMRSVGSTADVQVLAEFDCAGELGTRRYHFDRGGVGEEVITLGETDSGDPGTLDRFVGWAAEKYPAERYALILWNHGGGWAPTEIARLAEEEGARGFLPLEAVERASTGLGRVLFRSSWRRMLDLETAAERAICSDDVSGHSLDALELGRVLAAIAARLGKPLSLLGLDACLMSCVEVALEVADSVEVMVASEEETPDDGWPYGRLLGALAGEPETGARDFGARVVGEYVASYRREGYRGDLTLAALDLGRVGRVVDAVNGLAEALIGGAPDVAGTVWKAQRGSPHFSGQTQWDLARLAEEIGRLAGSDPVGAAARELRETLRPVEGGAVIAGESSGSGVAGCGGLSVYLPPLVRVSPYYRELAFAQSSRWMEWLDAYRSALPGPGP